MLVMHCGKLIHVSDGEDDDDDGFRTRDGVVSLELSSSIGFITSVEGGGFTFVDGFFLCFDFFDEGVVVLTDGLEADSSNNDDDDGDTWVWSFNVTGW
jgi:hypothetical protein